MSKKIPLITARRNLGLSAKDAADEIHISKTTLLRAEKGERIFSKTQREIVSYYKKAKVLPQETLLTDLWPIEDEVIS